MKPYNPGQRIACTVVRAKARGYAVTTIVDSLPGFLQTASVLQPGDEVVGVFIGTFGGRILLSEHLSTNRSMDFPLIHRRAIDFIIPPQDLKSSQAASKFTMQDRHLKTMLEDIEKHSKTTGCIKVSSKARKSRSAALLHEGHVVGCLYSDKKGLQALATEEAMAAMLSDLDDKDAEVTIYALPEEIILSLAALYLGHPQGTNEMTSAQTFFQETLQVLSQNGSTACLTLAWDQPKSTNLALVYKGKLSGTFNCEYQLFATEQTNLAYMFEQDAQAIVLVNMLKPDAMAPNKSFGYLLSDVEPRVYVPSTEMHWTEDLPDEQAKRREKLKHGKLSGRGYKAGQNVACKINYAEKDGYAVTITKDNLPGFIKTASHLKPGEEILGVFVCVHNGRILLSQLFKAPPFKMDDYLQESLDKNFDTATKNTEQIIDDTNEDLPAIVDKHYKRATDLIMPPVDLKSIRHTKSFKTTEHDLDWIIDEIEVSRQTGCIKISSSESMSRAAALLYQGKIVGCAYGSKEQHSLTLSMEECLQALLEDLDGDSTEVDIYDLPQEVVAAMATLFVGHLMDHQPDLNTTSYYDFAKQWCAETDSVACLTVIAMTPATTALVLIDRGKLVGIFNVNSQKFSREETAVYALLQEAVGPTIEINTLPAASLTSGKCPALSLAAENGKRKNKKS